MPLSISVIVHGADSEASLFFDLFLQEVLINGALEGLEKLVASSKEMPGMVNVPEYNLRIFSATCLECGFVFNIIHNVLRSKVQDTLFFKSISNNTMPAK